MNSVDVVLLDIPARPLYVICVFPSEPLLVVMSTTPAEAFAPYTAQAEASLRMDTEAISLGLTSVSLPSMPSTRIRGDPELRDTEPRMETLYWWDSMDPLPIVSNRPGSAPCRAFTVLVTGRLLRSFPSITATAPVTFTLRWVP